MYEVWFGAYTATECLRRFSTPSTFNLDSETSTPLRAQIRAIRCCTRPFLSTSETASAAIPQTAVTRKSTGACSKFVRQR
jgi:hypothetical protein